MRSEQGTPVRLSDYRPPLYTITAVDLDVSLKPHACRIVATLSVARRTSTPAGTPLTLDGDDLRFVSARLNGEVLPAGAFTVTPQAFVLKRPPARAFTLTLETVVDAEANTQLMGLYRSSGVWCTQCEAEGFRRITYFLDRPDVLSSYTTRIEADRIAAPVLLGNGNPVERGDLGEGRHYVVWHDPHPKPSYLFALVGGVLASVKDRFVTQSGREVELGIYVESGKEDRCAYAMDALKRSMRWDETAFGCEYDLDVFNIVAVSDFNMGAMENKGLNIFNDKYVLARPDTATDADYAHIEAIIAHEYFHNWTGNRITCRDWFQLCLKEGLTVYRDQEFSSDMRSRAVKRIADVRLLKSHQFPEDAGPLAHPVRPEIYHEINNFYTATVYEKGAEVIRVLSHVVGREAFDRGMRLYLSRHDGQAATIEDFIVCFAEASGQDLGQFMLWYRQSGTPRVSVEISHDAKAGTVSLDLRQSLEPTPGQPVKSSMVIPLGVALLDADGGARPLFTEDGEAAAPLVVMTREQQRFTFSGHPTRPVVSLNRGFTAPVALTGTWTEADLAFLAARDSDPFNRWQAVQTLAMRGLIASTDAVRGGRSPVANAPLLAALETALDQAETDPAFVAQLLSLPTEADVGREIATDVDPDAIFSARQALQREVGEALRSRVHDLRARLATPGPFSPDAQSAGRRALRAVLLDLWAQSGDREALASADTLYASADNMTEAFAALSVLSQHADPRREAVLDDFRRRHAGDPLILDKWLAVQASIPEAGTIDRVRRLLTDPQFAMTNPNRLRALIGTFATANPTQFNRIDGAGHALVGEVVREIDGRNPQVAARLLSSFRSWRSLEASRREQARRVLEGIASLATLSTDTRDIVSRSLG